MHKPREHFLAANGVSLHYLEWGAADAPAVLLLHGGSAHAHWWDFVAGSLAEGNRLIALDMRGHGESAHANPPAYELEDYVADVTAVVRSLRLRRLSVIGHSMGAVVAVMYAASAPVRIDAVVFVDILVRPSASGKRMLSRLGQMRHPVYHSRAEGVRRFRLLPTATSAPPEALAYIAERSLRDTPEGGCTPKFDRAALHDGVPRDIGAALSSLVCPVLYIRGEHSTLVPRRVLDEVKAIVPHARLAEIPNAYHHVMLDNPREFARVVRAFLRDKRVEERREK